MEDEDDDAGLDQVVQAFEREAANSALEWKNREDWKTRGRLKGLASTAVSAISLEHAPIGSVLVNIPKIIWTHSILCNLEDAKKLHSDWQDTIDYIIGKKQAKVNKAAVGIFLGAAVTAYSITKSIWKRLNNTKGKNRRAHAAKIYAGLINKDPAAIRIALALFTNSSDPQKLTFQLLRCDEELAIKVLMGKIASK